MKLLIIVGLIIITQSCSVKYNKIGIIDNIKSTDDNCLYEVIVYSQDGTHYKTINVDYPCGRYNLRDSIKIK